MDKIIIRDLALRCIVGIAQREREEKQDVLLTIVLHANLDSACLSDRIEDTLDYKAIKKKIISLVENSSFNLIEALAQSVADLCLRESCAQKVVVCIDKPGALRFSRSVAVKIVRVKK